ncbi:MAG: gluconate 2-dehydrogenase subunit 3 family protein [Saprospiraceae bacterium]|nr:gluconate 2-dehydrogenase subunit 3 family protein [Saprospiraceae bacterium]
MDRRTIIKHISILTGVAFIGGEVFIQSGCKPSPSQDGTAFGLPKDDISLLDEIGETIIPKTDTPGAKAIGIGMFMQKMISACYDNDQQIVFTKGVQDFKAVFENKYKVSFINATDSQKQEFVQELNTTTYQYQKNKKDKEADHYFTMIKQLTILGYFTSEDGATKALRYIAVPGKYDGSFAYKAGDKAWATS